MMTIINCIKQRCCCFSALLELYNKNAKMSTTEEKTESNVNNASKHDGEDGDAEAESKDKVAELETSFQPKRRIKIVRIDEEPPEVKMRPFEETANRRSRGSRDEDEFQQRVKRFLSIVDIPPEEVTFAMENYERVLKSKSSDPDERKSSVTKDHEVKRKYSKIGLSTARSNVGLSQEAKSRIIKEIIQNYDQKRFLRQITSTNVVEIKLEKKY